MPFQMCSLFATSLDTDLVVVAAFAMSQRLLGDHTNAANLAGRSHFQWIKELLVSWVKHIFVSSDCS